MSEHEQLVELSPRELAFADAVAARVLEVLERREPPESTGLVSAAELARLLGISRSTVYEHRDELAAVQLGSGRKPRLRFDVERAREAWTRRVGRERSEHSEMPAPGAVRRRRGAGRSGSDARLLPVKGRKAA